MQPRAIRRPETAMIDATAAHGDSSDDLVLDVMRSAGLASIQDLGRPGWRRLGVPAGGALDAQLLAIANRLAGAADDAPAIEALGAGLTLACPVDARSPLRLGLAGTLTVSCGPAVSPQPVTPWRSLSLQPGEQLAIRSGHLGYVAIAGLRIPRVLGSCATELRSGFGGWQGRALRAGDRLPVCADAQHHRQGSAVLTLSADGRRHVEDPAPIRILPGPQADAFADDALARLCDTAWQISHDSNRMGMRLIGPPLTPRGAAQIISDAVVPGAIQVPGNGQPILLLADAQTLGGYPKIATVISADLGRLARLAPGTRLQLALCRADDAEAAAREHAARTQAMLRAIGPLVDDAATLADGTRLASCNLISGVLRAEPD